MSTIITTTLSNTGVAPGAYNRVVVDSKGRVLTGSNLQFENGDVRGTTTGSSVTLDLQPTGVVAGTYAAPTIVIDSKGRIISASSVGGGGILIQGNSGSASFSLGSTLPITGVTGQLVTTATTSGVSIGFGNLTVISGTVVVGTLTNSTIEGTTIGTKVASSATFTTIKDTNGNIRSIPVSTQGTLYTITAADAGKLINISTGGIILPGGIMTAGDTVSIFNNSLTSQYIVPDSTLTLLQISTTNLGSRILSGYGFATIIFLTPLQAIISGSGVS
jgi:hypothetical protein